MNDLFGNPLTPEPEPNDFWYTPRYVMDCVRAFMPHYFDPCPVNPQLDGTTLDYWAADCFINPPYSQVLKRAFVTKGLAEFKPGCRFLWLLNFGNNQDLWELHSRASAVCIPKTRIRFIPGHPSLGDGNSPRYDNILVLMGSPVGFAAAFESVGKVYLA